MTVSRIERWIKCVLIPLVLVLTLGIIGTSLYSGYTSTLKEIQAVLKKVTLEDGRPSEKVQVLVSKGLIRYEAPEGEGGKVQSDGGTNLVPARVLIFRHVLYRQRHVLIVSVIALLLALEVSIFMAHVLTRPIKRLVWGCEQLASGHWVRFPGFSREPASEIEVLYRSFNEMVDGLKESQRLERETARVQRLAAFGQLMAGISHEIKNPLASMRIHLDLLHENLNDEGQESWEILSSELDRMKTTMTDLLNFAKPHPPRCGDVSFSYIAEWCERMVKGHIESKGIELRIVDGPPPVTFWADRVQLQQLLLNLLMNAVHALEGPGTIEVIASESEDTTCVQVCDNGKGIPGEIAESLFDPFVTTRPDGTGLGLTVVLQIVELHEGKVDYHRAQGKTVFTAEFPKRKEEAEE